MKLLLLLSLAVVQADLFPSLCPGNFVNGVYHTDELLKSDVDRPYSLSVDFTENTVYFCDYTHVSKIDLYTKELTHIDRPQGSGSVSVDPITGDVYIGGDSGVYKYNKITNKSEFFGANGTKIRMVFSKDIVYFTDAATNFLYTIIDGVVSRFEDLKYTTVAQFVIDNDDWMFFSNSSGLFRQKKGSYDAVHYLGTEYMRNTGLNVITSGDVYASFTTGIYSVNKQHQFVRRIVRIRHCYGLAFDDTDNIIYCDLSSIHYLWQSDEQSCDFKFW